MLVGLPTFLQQFIHSQEDLDFDFVHKKNACCVKDHGPTLKALNLCGLRCRDERDDCRVGVRTVPSGLEPLYSPASGEKTASSSMALPVLIEPAKCSDPTVSGQRIFFRPQTIVISGQPSAFLYAVCAQ